jgi:hypothetical protein
MLRDLTFLLGTSEKSPINFSRRYRNGMALNQQYFNMLQKSLPYAQGGVLLGAGRAPKYIRHCAGPVGIHGPKGKKRCAKFAPGPRPPPMGSGRSGGAMCSAMGYGPSGAKRCKQLSGDRTPNQKRYAAEVKAVAKQQGVSAAVAAHLIKVGAA